MAGTIFGSNGLLLASSQEYKEQIANELFRLISIGSAPILSRTLATPPIPQNIDSYYIVPTGATGAWAGKTNQIAYPVVGLNGLPTGVWSFWQPFTGLTVFLVSGETIFFNGTNWVLTSNFDQYSGDIEAPTIQTYPLDFALLRGYNVLSFSAISQSGTATISVKINGVDVPGLNNLSITSTRLTVPVTTGNFVDVGSRVELVVSAISIPKHLFFTVGRKYV
jgi:hypothetical protein